MLAGRGDFGHGLLAAERVKAPHAFGELRSWNDDEVGAEELH
jgi:hypothetical protein